MTSNLPTEYWHDKTSRDYEPTVVLVRRDVSYLSVQKMYFISTQKQAVTYATTHLATTLDSLLPVASSAARFVAVT